MDMPRIRTYRSTRDGVTRVQATAGDKADRRFARSGRWTLIADSGVIEDPKIRRGESSKAGELARIEREAAVPETRDGEAGTFDGPAMPRADGALPRNAESITEDSD